MTREKIFKQFEKDRYARLSGIRLTEVSEGYAQAELEISETQLNSVDTVHGGAIFTLADFVFAVASNSYGTLAMGINSSISFFKAVKRGTLTAEAQELSIHHKLASYAVRVTDQDNDLVAHFTGMVYRKREQLDP